MPTLPDRSGPAVAGIPIDRRELAAIFAGGAAGGLVRVAVERSLHGATSGWPWPTFAVNIAGAFALGYLAAALHERRPVSVYRHRLLGTGFCGALTTFSTVQIELLRMLDAQRYLLAGGYATGSVLAGLAGVHLATAMAHRLSGRRR